LSEQPQGNPLCRAIDVPEAFARKLHAHPDNFEPVEANADSRKLAMDIEKLITNSTEHGQMKPNAGVPSKMCLIPDDLSFVRELNSSISRADANWDLVITKDELETLKDSKQNDCARRIASAAIDNFDQLSKLAPHSLEDITTSDTSNYFIKFQMRHNLLDLSQNSAGISYKDLKVAEAVIDPLRSEKFAAGIRSAANKHGDESIRNGLITGVAGTVGTLLYGFATRFANVRPAKFVLLATTMAGIGQIARGTYMGISAETTVTEIENQLQLRKQFLTQLRKQAS
jgi:hypothetical protein